MAENTAQGNIKLQKEYLVSWAESHGDMNAHFPERSDIAYRLQPINSLSIKLPHRYHTK